MCYKSRMFLLGSVGELAIPCFVAAKEVCELSQWTITHLKLQKILYLLHLSYFCKDEQHGLIEEPFEAWLYGPVLPHLYDKLRMFSDRSVLDIFFNVELSLYESTSEISFIKEKYDDIAQKSTWDLVLETHLQGGAWEKNFEQNKNNKISNKDIFNEYERLWKK